ncbi:nucleotide synthetase [Caulobacter sp.]|uniref:nucleotide synthetase n=1 Tax=Caulobacter sp. TaxID=78 RepID=UPI003BAA1FEF
MNIQTPITETQTLSSFRNEFAAMPRDSAPADKFNPQSILHVLLKIDTSAAPRLRFVALPSVVPDPPGEIESYAKKVAATVAFHSQSTLLPSPFDVLVTQQCWLMVELDRSANWQFTEGELGCTTKGKTSTNNFGLRHAYADGTLGELDEPVTKPGCRVVYFGVARRAAGRPGPGNPGSEFMNFHVQFLADNGERLSVIFDPDIKNEGPSIP